MEINSAQVLAPVHKKQLLAYLRLADKRLGSPINCHVFLIQDGIARIVSGLGEGTLGKPHDATV